MKFFSDARGSVTVIEGKDVDYWQVTNPTKETLRGIHYQVAPYEREKIISVLVGSIRLVRIDLKKGRVTTQILRASESQKVIIGQACGYLTLEPNTTVRYAITGTYSQAHERGIRWDDPYFEIEWDAEAFLMNERDASWPDWTPEKKKK